MSAVLADSGLINAAAAGSRRTRRFVPPTATSLLPNAEQEAARAAAEAHASGLAEGHAQGWAEGHASGLQEGEARLRAAFEGRIAELERELTERRAQGAAGEALDHLLAARQADRSALEAACRAGVAAALRQLFPALMARGLAEEVSALIAEALAARQAERLVVRAHPETPAAPLLHELAARAPERLALDFDPAMGLAEVEMRWDEGGLIADWDALLARIVAVLDDPEPNRPEERAET